MAQMMRAMASMARMWNAFNQLSNQDTYGYMSGFGFPYDQWPGFSPWRSPWPSMLGRPRMSGFPGPGASWGERSYDPWNVLPSANRLDGIWQGLNGEIVTIRGNRIWIQNPSGQTINGAFMTYGNRMIAYCAQTDYTCSCTFERRGDMLALQNEAGDILLFRRLNRGPRW